MSPWRLPRESGNRREYDGQPIKAGCFFSTIAKVVGSNEAISNWADISGDCTNYIYFDFA